MRLFINSLVMNQSKWVKYILNLKASISLRYSLKFFLSVRGQRFEPMEIPFKIYPQSECLFDSYEDVEGEPEEKDHDRSKDHGNSQEDLVKNNLFRCEDDPSILDDDHDYIVIYLFMQSFLPPNIIHQTNYVDYERDDQTLVTPLESNYHEEKHIYRYLSPLLSPLL